MPQIITVDIAATASASLTTNADDSIFVAESVLVSSNSPDSPACLTIHV